MYMLLYLPEQADAELFGPFLTPQKAINLLRRISAAAGEPIDVTHSALMATIDVTIDGERHRYQLLKVGSDYQLEIHADIIRDIRASAHVSVASRFALPPPSQLSGY
ncbi:MAG: hypothetical protein LC739_12375 [Actinobacteria bacterium]|nr:hypothetical protein [Actinomycetota bacterium]